MLDVDIVADNWLQTPITAWTVRQHPSKSPVGWIKLTGGRYHLSTVMGESSAHDGLYQARDHLARLPPAGTRLC